MNEQNLNTENIINEDGVSRQVELLVSSQRNIKTSELKVERIKEADFDSVIIREHYLHRANSTLPAIHYGFYYQNQLVALQEWSAIFKPILLVGKRRLEYEGYNTKTTYSYKLEAEEFPNEFDTFEDAEKHIKENASKYTY